MLAVPGPQGAPAGCRSHDRLNDRLSQNTGSGCLWCMTLYILFAAAGILIYASAAFAAAISGVNNDHAAVGVQFALVAPALVFLAAIIIFYSARFLRRHALIAALVFGGAVSIVIAATKEPGDLQSGIGTNRSPVADVAAQSARALGAGEQLFEELGCSGCHRSDGKGIGPSLNDVFGRPVADPGCGALMVDPEYVRESILNPTATVAAGFAPVMPTFAGRVTEEQLRELIGYVTSLSAPAQAPRKPDGE